MEFSYSQTENFEMEKLSSDTGYFKKPVEINRGMAPLITKPKKAHILEFFLSI